MVIFQILNSVRSAYKLTALCGSTASLSGQNVSNQLLFCSFTSQPPQRLFFRWIPLTARLCALGLPHFRLMPAFKIITGICAIKLAQVRHKVSTAAPGDEYLDGLAWREAIRHRLMTARRTATSPSRSFYSHR